MLLLFPWLAPSPPPQVRALDIMFILHAEHELNCSTAAARHLASSGVDVYTAMSGTPCHVASRHGVYAAMLLFRHRRSSPSRQPVGLRGFLRRNNHSSRHGAASGLACTLTPWPPSRSSCSPHACSPARGVGSVCMGLSCGRA